MEDSEALSDVLHSIRVKDSIAAMDERPRFKRIYGTDIDPENTRENEWQELMARHKIKQRLKLARDRRMSKIKEMEKTIASNLMNSETSVSPEPQKRKSNKFELLQEYRAMKGKSINLKPTPDTSEENVDNSSETFEHDTFANSSESKKETNSVTTRESIRLSPENNAAVTTFISAVIETPYSNDMKHQSDLSKSYSENNYKETVLPVEPDKKDGEEMRSGNDSEKKEETHDGEYIEDRNDGDDNTVQIKQPKEHTNNETEGTEGDESKENSEEEEVVGDESKMHADGEEDCAERGKLETVIPKKKVKTKKKTKSKSTSKSKEKLKTKDPEAEKQNSKEIEESKIKEDDPKPKKTQSRWKKSVVKAMPLTTMCSKLRERISEENERQLDLLETIRILRGISKSEFYKDIELNQSDSDNEEIIQVESRPPNDPEPSPPEPSSPETEPQEETKSDELQLPVVVLEKRQEAKENVKQNKKRLISRVDSRWPVGHKFHTKPAEQKYLSIYLKPIHSKLTSSKINIHNLPRTAKEITEYLQWRERLLEIAYLNEFSHLRKMSLMSFTVPLPSIETHNFPGQSASNTSRSSRSTSSASKHQRHSISIQQNSILTFHKSSETKSKKTSVTQDTRQHKRKKHEGNQGKSFNVYLNHRSSKATEKNRSKHSKINTKHTAKKEQELNFAFAEENELETLISKMNEDSKHGVAESRIKSQSTDSAINEPSFDSDEDDCDVIITSNVNHSPALNDQRDKCGGVSLGEKDIMNKNSQKQVLDEDFMQTVHFLRTGRYRYLQPVDSKRGKNHHKLRKNSTPRQQNVISKNLDL